MCSFGLSSDQAFESGAGAMLVWAPSVDLPDAKGEQWDRPSSTGGKLSQYL